MLISFFKKSYLFQYVFFVWIAGLLWFGTFIIPSELIPGTDPFLQPAYALILKAIGSNGLVGKIIALILVLTGAFLFNQILIKHELVPKNTLIPALVYMTLMSHSDHLLKLEPALIAGMLLLYVLHFLFQVYTEEDAYSQIFNSGFLTGVASFIYFPSIFFIFFIWLTFIVYRLYKWREWFIPITGVAIPYMFLLTYFFWFDQLDLVIQAYLTYFGSLFPLQFNFELDPLNYAITGIILFLFLWSFLKMAADIQEKNISIRKRFGSVFWFFFISFMIYIFADFHDTSHLILLTIPLSVYISNGFSHLRKKIWIELLFGVLLILIILNNFKEVFFK